MVDYMAQARSRSRRFLAALAIATLVVSGAVVGQTTAAWAADYPSWADVQNARNSESAKQAQIAKLEALLLQLEANVASTQAESERKGEEYYQAQQAHDAAAYKVEQLQIQADEAQLAADVSIRQAGQIAAKVQRASGQDISVQLFFGDDSQSDLLSNLGMASKVNEQSSGIYAKAKRDQNTAQSLQDEAEVAREALKELAAIAEAAMVEAQKAADAAVSPAFSGTPAQQPGSAAQPAPRGAFGQSTGGDGAAPVNRAQRRAQEKRGKK